MNTTAKIEPATVRILQTEGFRLKELIQAMFGNQVRINLSIDNVPQDHIEFINQAVDDKTVSYSSHLFCDGLSINIESIDKPLPF